MMQNGISNRLAEKYNKPVPRYTSYPTIPFWNDLDGQDRWASNFKAKFEEQNHENGISIYIRLPFCETLCTYCGCNETITKNHNVELHYVAAIEKEWTMYRKLMNQTPAVKELHLNGGTPTFFSPDNLVKLVTVIMSGSIRHPKHEFSFEGHPSNTTAAHFQALATLGFRRINFGVQDNDPAVQKLMNRIEPFENVLLATKNARAVGFTSITFDLSYGLPFQTPKGIQQTFNQVMSAKPERVAFYRYAHEPPTSKGQRLYDEHDLPSPNEQLQLCAAGKEVLAANGYHEIGMDHFALASDDLYIAWEDGRLHRNFMGYTTKNSGLLLGLGTSSVSDIGIAFAQNSKILHEYYAKINNGELAVKNGYFLNEQDIDFRKYITDISCNGKTEFKKNHLPILERFTYPKLADLEKDGLIEWSEKGLNVTNIGRTFTRNICSAFDLFLNGWDSKRRVFSSGI